MTRQTEIRTHRLEPSSSAGPTVLHFSGDWCGRWAAARDRSGVCRPAGCHSRGARHRRQFGSREKAVGAFHIAHTFIFDAAGGNETAPREYRERLLSELRRLWLERPSDCAPSPACPPTRTFNPPSGTWWPYTVPALGVTLAGDTDRQAVLFCSKRRTWPSQQPLRFDLSPDSWRRGWGESANANPCRR